jgi:5'-3' exoribonuclease 2
MKEERRPGTHMNAPSPNASAQANRDAAQNLKRSREGELNSPPPSKRYQSSNPNAPKTPESSSSSSIPNSPNTPNTPSTPNTPNAPAAEQEDRVQLGMPGYRERYYTDKFHSDLTDIDAIREICKSYVEGLSWVLRYYYQGCCSWKWYYPYHYAPFAADIAEWLGEIKPSFSLGQPFRPFEQLMGVLPPASAKCVPRPYRYIMGVHDEGEEKKESPIPHFYPIDFKLDRNGKKMLWQAVVLLPFIEETALLSALSGVDSKLTEAEKNRNTLGEDLLFVNTHHPLAPSLVMAQELKDGMKVFFSPSSFSFFFFSDILILLNQVKPRTSVLTKGALQA